MASISLLMFPKFLASSSRQWCISRSRILNSWSTSLWPTWVTSWDSSISRAASAWSCSLASWSAWAASLFRIVARFHSSWVKRGGGFTTFGALPKSRKKTFYNLAEMNFHENLDKSLMYREVQPWATPQSSVPNRTGGHLGGNWPIQERGT